MKTIKENKFKIPANAEKLIQLQRTELGDNLGELFYKSVEIDYNEIKSSLNDYKVALDIGCGVGGIDYFLGKRNPNAKLLLLDKTEVEDRIYYGYERKGCFYNNLKITSEFLSLNEVTNDSRFIDIGSEEFPNEKVDLVISLISWGFHYPINTYLDKLDKILSEDGIIIVDLRKISYEEGLNEFKKLGYIPEILVERQKYYRVKFTKSKSL